MKNASRFTINYTNLLVSWRDVKSHGLTIASLRRQRKNLSNSFPAERDTIVFFGLKHTSYVHKYYMLQVWCGVGLFRDFLIHLSAGWQSVRQLYHYERYYNSKDTSYLDPITKVSNGSLSCG